MKLKNKKAEAEIMEGFIGKLIWIILFLILLLGVYGVYRILTT